MHGIISVAKVYIVFKNKNIVPPYLLFILPMIVICYLLLFSAISMRVRLPILGAINTHHLVVVFVVFFSTS